MMITWIDPTSLLEYELTQLEQEGRDVGVVRRRWECFRHDETASVVLRTSAQMLLKELDRLSALTCESTAEPSTLEGILGLCGNMAACRREHPPSKAALRDRIAGGWFGRAAGCLLGKPVEKIPREGIRKLLSSNDSWPLSAYITERGIPAALLSRYPWNRHNGRESLRENIQCMPEDDDMNYPMLNLGVLESSGIEFTTEDIAGAWLLMLPVLSTFTAERVAYLNCLKGILVPETAFHRNPYREWIGAQIRGAVFGWMSPGDPLRAATLACKDARLSHVRNGIYGEMFVAAMVARATVSSDVHDVVESGLAVVPPASRMAEAIRFARALPAVEPTWEGAVDRLYGRYGDYHWVHTINNTALVVAALLYGNMDFGTSICNVVMGGWDTDSNGATVGSVVGTILGERALPRQWVEPLADRIRSSLKGFDNVTISGLADRTLVLASPLT